MGERINQKKLKKEIKNLIDFTPPDISGMRNINTQAKKHPIYRSVLGCSYRENSTSRFPWDVKSIKKEESQSLVLKGGEINEV